MEGRRVVQVVLLEVQEVPCQMEGEGVEDLLVHQEVGEEEVHLP